MINSKRRAELYMEAHRPQWQKDLVKLIKWGLFIALGPIVILAMLDPRNWIWFIGYLVISPMWRR